MRTIFQIAAGGALTLLVTTIAGGLEPYAQGLVMGAWTALVAFLQNWLETAGRIPALLPTPGLLPVVKDVLPGAAPIIGHAVGTVEAVATEAGNVVGEVVDQAGEMVGEVTGGIDPPEEGEH
jgi:hypothetical protein